MIVTKSLGSSMQGLPPDCLRSHETHSTKILRENSQNTRPQTNCIKLTTLRTALLDLKRFVKLNTLNVKTTETGQRVNKYIIRVEI